MNILLLAPHPFYQERGTPIAVDLLLRVLSKRGDAVDVLTYSEGRDLRYANVAIHRIPKVPGVKNVPPGFSWKKLVCDTFMAGRVLAMVLRKRYHLIHAVEESVFMAMPVRFFFRIPYVYDMDSSMPQQIVEKHRGAAFLSPVLSWFEGRAVRGAAAVIPVCDSLAEIARRQHARKIAVLRDVSLLTPDEPADGPERRRDLGISGVCFMYVGNLEAYQGIDLLLESFAIAVRREPALMLAIAGGSPADIEKYRRKAAALGAGQSIRFLGPQPVDRLRSLLAAADVLVSPRIRGNNTPMKIYSYLASGRPVLATDLPTHTQVLTPEVASLAPPSPEPFALAMLSLARDAGLRARLAAAAGALAQARYSFAVFADTLNGLYDSLSDSRSG